MRRIPHEAAQRWCMPECELCLPDDCLPFSIACLAHCRTRASLGRRTPRCLGCCGLWPLQGPFLRMSGALEAIRGAGSV